MKLQGVLKAFCKKRKKNGVRQREREGDDDKGK